jgi:hypothetical protein
MKRRTFLQSLAALLVPKPARQTPAQPAYSDSAGRSAAELASLHDGKRASGGVRYAA